MSFLSPDTKHHNKFAALDAKTTRRVNTFGQVAVKFHQNPTSLRHWFEDAEQRTAHEAAKKLKQANRLRREKSKLPAPRLHIAIHIVGSRGDVQPFIPIAKLLQEAPHRHRVRICTHPAFKEFVESNGLEFFSINGDPEALMAYMVKNPGLLPSKESVKAGDIGKRRKEMAEIIEGTWRSCIEAGDGTGEKITAIDVDQHQELFLADVIIANPPSMGHIHCAEKLGIPLHIVFTMPWSPTKAFHHPLAAMEYGDIDKPVANYFSFAVMELLTWQGLGDLINKFRVQTLKLDAISPMWGFQLLQRLRVPHSYLWSQSLIARPPDWPPHLSVTGFSFLDQGSTYTPPEDLAAFLQKGPTPVYIGFGSIVVDDPKKLTELILEAVRLAGVRAIVSKGWGGIGGGEVPDSVYLIGNCPHDWLFQRVSCVVHHGGAGTTAAGIALGVPTVVVPFFGDQPFWGQMIARAGAGPKPVPFKQMTAESLAASIKFALRDEVKIAVQEMAAQIAKEDGAAATVEAFEQNLDIDKMRCHVCPERLAVWRDKKTGAHLCSLAACVLVKDGSIHPRHLRLLRHRRWYVHEGAEGPLVGAVAAVAGFAATLGTNTTDFSDRLRRPDKSESGRPTATAKSSESHESDVQPKPDTPSSGQLENMAQRMAKKRFEDDLNDNLRKPPGGQSMLFVKLRSQNCAKNSKQGRARQITSAAAQYTVDVSRTSLRAPVAFFYNVANGFRNFPSYTITNEPHRRRDEITGIGSGLGVAGKEFVFGLGEGVGSIVWHPYIGAKREGPLGAVRGVGRGLGGLWCHVMAACWGLPGYTLKGIEREINKHRLTSLQAEIYLIRLRQSLVDFDSATPEDKARVVEGWKTLQHQR
ncbi:hypothetical protein HBH56_237920 [Parastagonospora nodorum]|uniref:Glycosyltransferase family 28 N-terminal domain-containing protein n=1 Tax=Phaeosphaeria nodorum (strain SN15 / ATCC MYA-4574 / FGSC 10173) TaxID=321614 RepID=A0A7U2I869_PHANO|nr:hypothetical protein HBH56_237920 [Parastagonospora nodorum]QRD03828.1 hypothetical protein JI435_136970 [Parastagonospora nodorum SN15]KAH3924311.1 hypothetical protein HBH54_198140 [Parastagonospora nodorum]KAH4131959.1 hypothetical protein HBH45_185060 [Parastagonospora nodorum]KAH4149852.1 hypothetical protein HBH44_185760 [Parastagonospora nodorum]